MASDRSQRVSPLARAKPVARLMRSHARLMRHRDKLKRLSRPRKADRTLLEYVANDVDWLTPIDHE